MTVSSNARVIETVISNIMYTQFSELELKDQKLNKNIQNLQKIMVIRKKMIEKNIVKQSI